MSSSIAMDNRYFLAADVGGTNVRMAAFSLDGRVLKRLKVPSAAADTHQAMTDLLCKLAQEIMDSDALSEYSPMAIGVGIAGGVAHKNGVVTQSPAFPKWKNFPLGDALRRQLNLPAYVDNDVNLGTLGEHWKGAAKDVTDCIGVFVGTGVGGCIMLEGEPFRGPSEMAGEIGHMCISLSGPNCHCGSQGCVEAYFSGWAIERNAKQSLQEGKCKGLASLLNGEDVSTKSVFEAARRGDEQALAILNEGGYALGVSFGNLINLLSVDLFVLGGAVLLGEGDNSGFDLIKKSIVKGMTDTGFREPTAQVTLVKAQLGDDAVLYGAAKLALDMEQGLKPQKIPILDQYQILRAQWVDEDQLINHRLTWLLLVQAMLFAAYLSLDRIEDRSIANSIDPQYVPWIGIIFCVLVLSSIGAGIWQMWCRYRKWNEYCKNEYRTPGTLETPLLGARWLTLIFGLATPVLTPILLMICWAFLI
ncbi:MAG: ROK family protein [Deltaproteobacteria bacterium]|nr:ROK family protein [Deltaproteobacteria bacterium]